MPDSLALVGIGPLGSGAAFVPPSAAIRFSSALTCAWLRLRGSFTRWLLSRRIGTSPSPSPRMTS
jgi:hypothetical protein